MRLSRMLAKTYKESPKDAEVISHQLMSRASMIKKVASGVYTYLPMGYKVLKKVEKIVREEMDRAGAQEILMPLIQPAELWQESGRWDTMGPEMMRIKDRHQRDFILQPTSEEVVTDLIRNEISSYKQLPLNVYQIQTKFRDERRPRFGLMRGREFVMKDAYSFHADDKSLDDEYQNMKKAYIRIFDRLGLNYRAVEADAGNIGGSTTEEFHVLANSGEDDIFYCNTCDYAANSEKAVSKLTFDKVEEEEKELTLVDTPDVSSIEDVANFLKVSTDKTIKCMVYKSFFEEENTYYVALIRGDYEINEVKLKNISGAVMDLELIEDDEFERLGLVKGFSGTHGVKDEKFVIIADESIRNITNAVVGANIKDKHYINANPERDLTISKYADIRMVKTGEPCPKCGKPLEVARGIEVGHIFQLGTKYSKALNANFLDQNGKQQVMTMGCYGIGVSRVAAAAIEQNNDENGMIWPRAIAPFEIVIINANIKDETINSTSEKLYSELLEKGQDVIIDDRNERIGFKFKDAELIGFPVQIVVGKGAVEGKVEVKTRKTKETFEVEIDKVTEFVKELLKGL